MFDKFDDCSMEKKSVSIECRTIFANSNTHLYFGITCSRYYIFLVIISIFGFTKHHLYRLQTLPIKSRIIDSVRFGKNLVLRNCYRSNGLNVFQKKRSKITSQIACYCSRNFRGQPSSRNKFIVIVAAVDSCT